MTGADIQAVVDAVEATAPDMEPLPPDLVVPDDGEAGGEPVTLPLVALFDGLSDVQRGILSGAAEPMRVRTGAELFREGDLSDRLYVVVRGRIQLRIGGKVIGAVSTGGVVGARALLEGDARSETARAVRETWLMAIDGPSLRRAMSSDAAMAATVYRNLAQELADLVDSLRA